MQFDDTAGVVAGLAIAAGAAWTWIVVPRYEARRALIDGCSHSLCLDVPQGWAEGATLRCSKCPYQEPAREWLAAYHAEREAAAMARRIECCPQCGSREL